MCMRGRASNCVCVCVWMTERESECVFACMQIHATLIRQHNGVPFCVCACVCLRERESVRPVAGLLLRRLAFERIFKTQGIFKIKERFQVMLE